MKFAILIPTYRRSDGSTTHYLERAIQSIINQSRKDWKIFLIGDRYEQPKEVIDLCKNLINEHNLTQNITFHNLTKAEERDNNYPKELLWKYGGVNARNTGIKIALTEGYRWICHLDHDDFWKPNHLEEINKLIEDKNYKDTAWICTLSTYLHEGNWLPILLDYKKIVPFEPKPQGTIHSSVCIDYHRIPLFYVDKYKEVGYNKDKVDNNWLPADADLWKRTSEFLQLNPHLKSYCINEITCEHLEEGFENK